MRMPILRKQNEQVADGTRTRDHRDHNPELYQLSYRHLAPQQDSATAAAYWPNDSPNKAP